MKLLLLISFYFYSCTSFGQTVNDFYNPYGTGDTAIVKLKGYDIQFVYDARYWMDDLVGRMKCDDSCNLDRYIQGLCKCVPIENPKHYFATVRVFKGKKQIGKTMTGYYMKDETCFDADPEAYLRQALKEK